MFYAGCSRLDSEPREPQKAHSGPETQVVAVVPLSKQSLSREVTLHGEFRAYQSVEVHAKVAGYIQRIFVDVGDRVASGQLLATLEVPEMAAELEEAAAVKGRADANLLRAQADRERAQANVRVVDLAYTRLEKVSKTESGLIPQQELDEALARRRAASADLSAAEAAYTAAQQQVAAARATEQRVKAMSDYTRISAPFQGVVTKRYADTGSMIQAGTASQSQAMPVVRVAEVRRLRLAAIVPESVVPMVRVGQPVEVRVESLGRSFESHVSRMTGDVQTGSRTMEVEIDVDNSRGDLAPGMFADVSFTLSRPRESLTVPVQGVTDRGGKRSVLVVNRSGIVEQRDIRTGIEGTTSMEVLAGLESGDRVVVGNRALLMPGQRVEAKLVDLD